MLNEPFCKECYFRSSCDGIVGGPQCATNASGTQPTSTNTQSTAIAKIAGSLDWWADRVKVDDFVNSELVDVLEGLSQQLRTL